MRADIDKRHEMMGRMDQFAQATPEESDYLAGVDKLAAERAEPSLPSSLGMRVQYFREQKGLSLEDVAQRCGLSLKELERIEDDLANPPLGVLIKLGKALDMRFGRLIANGENLPYTIVRVAERQDISRYPSSRQTSYGYSYQSLAPRKKDRSMEPVMVTLVPTDEAVEPSTHEGQEFVFVLDGRMEAVLGDTVEVLEAGDSIYYDSSQPHLLRPAGDEPVRILAVLTGESR